MTTRKAHHKSAAKTRRANAFELLPKTRGARIPTQTYKANCLNNRLEGYKSLKTGEENTDFGHVLLASLDGYEGSVIVKISGIDQYLMREKMGLSEIEGFKYHARLICDFRCDDENERWMKQLTKSVKFCKGNEPLHFFIMEYISNGDIGKYIGTLTDKQKLCSIITQIMYCFIELGQKYKIYHGDIHSGNILVDNTDDEYSVHIVNGEERKVRTFGKIPKIVDFGRCGKFDKKSPTDSEIIYQLIFAVCAFVHYIQDSTIKQKINAVSLRLETEFKSVDEYLELISASFVHSGERSEP